MKVDLLSHTTDTTDLPVYALANNWYVRKSISLANDMFDYAVSEERAQVGSSRWNDFRIKPEVPATGAAASNAPLIYPVVNNYDGTQAIVKYGTTGEYNYSAVEVGSTATTFCLGRASASGRYNIFEEFDKMGPNPPESPVGTISGGYDLVDATFEKEEVEELLNKGNLPPYEADLTTTTPQVWVEVGRLGRAAAGTAELTTGYFDAPLGIVWIPGLLMGDEASVPKIGVEFQSGDYKGVMSLDI